MAKINLETEPRFKDIMKQFGFKKTRYGFVRQGEEYMMRLGFGHATNGQKFVRYYSCTYSVDFSKIEEIAQKMGVYIFGHFGHVGYLTPNDGLLEWRLAESDTDEYYLHMINEIKETLNLYVIPYMERFSTLESFIEGIESGTIRNSFDPKAVVIAYVLLGRKEAAFHYIDEYIEKQKKLDFYGKGVEIVEGEGYRRMTIYPKENKNLAIFIDFVQKMKSWMNTNDYMEHKSS